MHSERANDDRLPLMPLEKVAETVAEEIRPASK